MKNILITGGSGFIGTYLIKSLKADKITNIDIKEPVDSGTRHVHQDIRDRKQIQSILKKSDFDVIFHLAALTKTAESMIKPDEYFETNVNGTWNIIREMKPNTKLIFTSSASVYGETDYRYRSKETDTVKSLSTYALTKILGEQIVKTLSNYIIFRLGNVIGTYGHGFANYLIKTIKKGAYVQVYRFGTLVRDYIYISDVVKALIKGIELPNGIYNVGTGIPRTNGDLVKLVLSKLNYEKVSWDSFCPSGFAVSSCLDNSKLKSYGWIPRLRLEQMIDKLWNG